MSHREIRNFTETMRAIGYPRLISMENFSKPNFELVADILFWMIRRYDPSTVIHDSIETESDRVKFLIDVTKVPFVTYIHLNRKSLYAANGLAVKEMLKLANLLQRSIAAVNSYPGIGNFDDFKMPLSVRADIRDIRNLTNELTQIGSKIHTHLSKENFNKVSIENLLLKLDNGNSDIIEKQLEVIRNETREELEKTKKQTSYLEVDTRSMSDQIENGKQDLDRIMKRLESLDNIKPAFMDEYEALETELKTHYEEYVIRYRNLMYLQGEVEKTRRKEREEKAIRMKEIARYKKKWKENDDILMRGEEVASVQQSISSGQSSSKKLGFPTKTILERGNFSTNSCNMSSEMGSLDDSMSSNISSSASQSTSINANEISTSIGSDDIF